MNLCIECGVNPVTKPGGECADCRQQEAAGRLASLHARLRLAVERGEHLSRTDAR